MAYNFKEYMERPDRLTAGHRMCAGCGASIALRNVMKAVHPEDHAVICNATSCMEVSTFIYPYTAWQDSYIHTAFENAGATCSGVEAAYRAMSKKGKIGGTYKFIAVGGDGGTYDIGFQSLSGAMERNTDMVYVCYDNEAYMNTGIQGSSSTPYGAWTTTTPGGKATRRKDLLSIVMAHDVPYCASASVAYIPDLRRKVQKAKDAPGPAVLHVHSPCPTGWGCPPAKSIEVCRVAVQCGAWLLYEYENGKITLNQKPKQLRPVSDYVKLQGRFRGMDEQAAALQAQVTQHYEEMLHKSE